MKIKYKVNQDVFNYKKAFKNYKSLSFSKEENSNVIEFNNKEEFSLFWDTNNLQHERLSKEKWIANFNREEDEGETVTWPISIYFKEYKDTDTIGGWCSREYFEKQGSKVYTIKELYEDKV